MSYTIDSNRHRFSTNGQKGRQHMTRGAGPVATNRPMNRGEFLKNSLLLMLVGASCLLSKSGNTFAADAVRDIVRGPGRQGPTNPTKPALTEENLNQFIAAV